MNNTNRALNRVLLGITGSIFLAAGILLAWTAVDTAARERWDSAGTRLLGGWRNLAASAPLPEPLGSWWAVAVPAGLLLGAAVCVGWLSRQGGGRTSEAARHRNPAHGDTAVDISFIDSAVAAAVDGNRAVAGSSVTAWRAGGGRHGNTQGLRITLQARRGASPRELADIAESLAAAIDALLGHRTTVLVRIAGGTRARLAGTHRTS